MIIDFHTHVFPPRVKEKRSSYTTDPLFNELYSSPKAKLATAEDLIASMDKHNVDISVVLNIGWASPELCTETNDYIMESVARYSDRLIGFGTAAPAFPDSAAREIERCARGGMRGIGEMRLDSRLFDANDQETLGSFVNDVIGSRLILLLHSSEPVGHVYPGKGDTTPDRLYSLITRFPQLTLVCAHWGGGLPFYAHMPEVKETLSNVLFDTAASPFLYDPGIYTQVIQALGPQSVLFGTDYPLLSPSRLLNQIEALDLDPETRQKILSGNACSVLGIPCVKNEGSQP